MTGEITLTGHVLPVGGIKEKVLAARRLGLHEVILPHQNERNINEDITEELRRDLTVHYVSTVEEALAIALTPARTPSKAKARKRTAPPRRKSKGSAK
jgi:ATP-dependent Lon protease